MLLKQLSKHGLLTESLFLWVDDLILCGNSGEETLNLLDRVCTCLLLTSNKCLLILVFYPLRL